MTPIDPDVARQLATIGDPFALLLGLFAHSPVPHMLFDVEGHPVVANAAYRAMFGALPPREYSVLRDEVAARAGLTDAVRRAFLGESVQTPTFWYDPKELQHIEVTDANRVAISCTFFPLRGADGAVAHVAVTYKDVTAELAAKEAAEAERDRLAAAVAEKERLAQALHESDERLRGTLEAAAVGTWEWLIPEQRVEWSPNIEAIFGLAPGQFDGTYEGWLALVHADDRAAVSAAVANALEGGGSYDVEFRYVRPDGSTGWQSGRGHVVRDPEGRPRALRGVVLDVTARRRAELEQVEARQLAERANRAKDEFLAMLGHELRNPLAPIVTAIELMKLRSQGGAFEKERAIIERQVGRVVRLVDDLLDVSRIVEGKVTLERQPVEIADCVALAIEQCRPLLEQHAQEVAVDVPPGLVVEGDGFRLAQVFSNLLNNSAKYTPRGGHVTITAGRDGGDVRVSVRDDGIGIRAEMLPQVFELFVQERQPLDRSSGGLGLGLAIVRSMVALHRGRVEARSDGHGRGTEIVVWLPAGSGPGAIEAAAADAAPDRAVARRRVLVVDDNVDAAALVAAGLRASGHEVVVAPDGASALSLLDAFVPEIALLDLGLPMMDGYELARQIHARSGLEALPLVAVTGYGQAGDRDAAAAAGFVELLVKPVALPALLDAVERLVD